MNIVSGNMTKMMPNPIIKSFFILNLSKETRSIILMLSGCSKKYNETRQITSTRVPYTVHHEVTEWVGDVSPMTVNRSIMMP
jgi:hypothetical protein